VLQIYYFSFLLLVSVPGISSRAIGVEASELVASRRLYRVCPVELIGLIGGIIGGRRCYRVCPVVHVAIVVVAHQVVVVASLPIGGIVSHVC